ncbi:DUF2111 domain-containing protein [Methanosarcina sp. T3]|uniref:DUF2111 domain-containing protein n=1 Tax=Methanosarcina sp. T3 TaxID=3439062 RepID=UPI003F82D3C4
MKFPFFACTGRQVLFGGENIISLSISEDSGPEDLEPIAAAVHSLTGLPTTIRSLKRKGLRLEKGKVLDRDYTGPVLEEVLKTNKVAHEVPAEGMYRGKHVVVAPIRSKDGKVIAALGIVDLLATIDLPSVFQEYTSVLEEVEHAKK